MMRFTIETTSTTNTISINTILKRSTSLNGAIGLRMYPTEEFMTGRERFDTTMNSTLTLRSRMRLTVFLISVKDTLVIGFGTKALIPLNMVFTELFAEDRTTVTTIISTARKSRVHSRVHIYVQTRIEEARVRG
jgi:hypothetical protein